MLCHDTEREADCGHKGRGLCSHLPSTGATHNSTNCVVCCSLCPLDIHGIEENLIISCWGKRDVVQSRQAFFVWVVLSTRAHLDDGGETSAAGLEFCGVSQTEIWRSRREWRIAAGWCRCCVWWTSAVGHFWDEGKCSKEKKKHLWTSALPHSHSWKILTESSYQPWWYQFNNIKFHSKIIRLKHWITSKFLWRSFVNRNGEALTLSLFNWNCVPLNRQSQCYWKLIICEWLSHRRHKHVILFWWDQRETINVQSEASTSSSCGSVRDCWQQQRQQQQQSLLLWLSM